MFQPIFFEYSILLIPPIFYLTILIFSFIRLNSIREEVNLRRKINIVNVFLISIFLLPVDSVEILQIKIFIFSTPYSLLFWDNIKKPKKSRVDLWFYYVAIIAAIMILNDIIIKMCNIDYRTVRTIYISFYLIISIILSFYFFAYKLFDGTQNNSLDKNRAISLSCVNIISYLVAITISLISNSNFPVHCATILLFLIIHLFISLNLVYATSFRVKLYKQVFQRRESLHDEPITIEYGRLKTDMDILAKLVNLFEEHKPFLNREITITAVAATIGTNRTYLSKALNSRTNKNFNEFVNYYRVRESCARFIASPTENIMDIIEICGFNNFSSANNAFKLCIGTTPKEWSKLVQAKLENNERINVLDYIS